MCLPALPTVPSGLRPSQWEGWLDPQVAFPGRVSSAGHCCPNPGAPCELSPALHWGPPSEEVRTLDLSPQRQSAALCPRWPAGSHLARAAGDENRGSSQPGGPALRCQSVPEGAARAMMLGKNQEASSSSRERGCQRRLRTEHVWQGKEGQRCSLGFLRLERAGEPLREILSHRPPQTSLQQVLLPRCRVGPWNRNL